MYTLFQFSHRFFSSRHRFPAWCRGSVPGMGVATGRGGGGHLHSWCLAAGAPTKSCLMIVNQMEKGKLVSPTKKQAPVAPPPPPI